MDSVICTQNIQKKADIHPERQWVVEQGNVLDENYMEKFYGKYDIVYSWGVLHHTGDMKKAMKLAGKCVRRGGKLFVSIYNDQGVKSKIWEKVKKTYNQVSDQKKKWILFGSSLYLYGWRGTKLRFFDKEVLKIRDNRGMNPWADLVDWVGGYPFEYSSPDEIITYYLKQGFKLVKLQALDRSNLGCNQFVFEKE